MRHGQVSLQNPDHAKKEQGRMKTPARPTWPFALNQLGHFFPQNHKKKNAIFFAQARDLFLMQPYRLDQRARFSHRKACRFLLLKYLFASLQNQA